MTHAPIALGVVLGCLVAACDTATSSSCSGPGCPPASPAGPGRYYSPDVPSRVPPGSVPTDPGGPTTKVDGPPPKGSCYVVADNDGARYVATARWTSNRPPGDSCGRDAPCLSVVDALDIASDAPVAIHLANETFDVLYTLELRPNMTIDGGWRLWWEAGAALWWKPCTVAAADTHVRVHSDLALKAKFDGSAKLSDLFIESVSPNENSVGLDVRGAQTQLELANVNVWSSRGADGAAGANGHPGAAGSSGCAPGDAASAVGGANGNAAPAGTWDAEGFHSSAGTRGADGAAGNAGAVGEDGTCVVCVTQCSSAPPCTVDTKLRQCGATGAVGCGGGGGQGGGGGAPGGSSVALFVWDAAVVVSSGILFADRGGNGGRGGDGGGAGAPGVGATGASSPPVACSSQCEYVQNACTGTTPVIGSGGAGSVGGAGGAGGAGGSGAAGVSYAIVRGGAATVARSPKTTLLHYEPASPNGAAGDELVVP